MAVYENTTIGPGWQGQDGDIYINVTIYAQSTFGKGTVFVNPTFNCCCWYNYYSNAWSTTGDGSVIDGGGWNCVAFGINNTLKSGGGAAWSMGPGSTLNEPPRAEGGGTGNYKAAGQIVTANEHLVLAEKGAECGCVTDGRWDREVIEKGYMIINDDGTATVQVPLTIVGCDGR